MVPIVVSCSIHGGVICLITVELVNLCLSQNCKIQLSWYTRSPAPFSSLLFSFLESCKKHRCRQPRSWRRPNTKFKLYKQVWYCCYDLYQWPGWWWDKYNERESGLSLNQILQVYVRTQGKSQQCLKIALQIKDSVGLLAQGPQVLVAT